MTRSKDLTALTPNISHGDTAAIIARPGGLDAQARREADSSLGGHEKEAQEGQHIVP